MALYLDSDVFLLPVLYENDPARSALRILKSIREGHETGATSTLALDEFLWMLLRNTDRKAAHAATQAILSFPNLRILPVRAEHVRASLDILEQTPGLLPRDAIHAAIALAEGIPTIVSSGAEFDAVQGLRRAALE